MDSSKNPFKCDLCENAYKQKKSLRRHREIHHSNIADEGDATDGNPLTDVVGNENMIVGNDG